MNLLENKMALVAGGAGGVGEGIVASFLKENATVIVPSRSADKLKRLKEFVQPISSGKLITLEGNIGDAEEIKSISQKIKQDFQKLDIVVASLGGWWQGKGLVELDLDTWNKILQDNLSSHFLAVKYFVPLLFGTAESFYIHINGFSAEKPYPNAAPVAMAAAAQKMMAQTLALELREHQVKVYELILGPMKTRYRQAYGQKKEEWYYPEEVGDYIQSLIGKKNGRINETVHYLLEKK